MTKLNKIKKELEENNIKYYDIGETQSPAGHKYIDILYVSFDKENIEKLKNAFKEYPLNWIKPNILSIPKKAI